MRVESMRVRNANSYSRTLILSYTALKHVPNPAEQSAEEIHDSKHNRAPENQAGALAERQRHRGQHCAAHAPQNAGDHVPKISVREYLALLLCQFRRVRIHRQFSYGFRRSRCDFPASWEIDEWRAAR